MAMSRRLCVIVLRLRPIGRVFQVCPLFLQTTMLMRTTQCTESFRFEIGRRTAGTNFLENKDYKNGRLVPSSQLSFFSVSDRRSSFCPWVCFVTFWRCYFFQWRVAVCCQDARCRDEVRLAGGAAEYGYFGVRCFAFAGSKAQWMTSLPFKLRSIHARTSLNCMKIRFPLFRGKQILSLLRGMHVMTVWVPFMRC